MNHDDAENLRAKLIGILGRIITVEELRSALEMKRQTYYDQVKEGRLMSLDNLKLIAHNLNVNEVWLLTECKLIDKDAVKEYCEMSNHNHTLTLHTTDTTE